jgi:hypothetical protein
MSCFLAAARRNKPSRGRWFRARPAAETQTLRQSADFQRSTGNIFRTLTEYGFRHILTN